MGDLSKDFSSWEFRCPCGCGAELISPVLITKLQQSREVLGRPIDVTSGVRCIMYNEKIGGYSNSPHIGDGKNERR